MKILQVVYGIYPKAIYGGISDSVIGLSRALAKQGHNVTILTTIRSLVDANFITQMYANEPFTVKSYPCQFLRYHVSRGLRSFLKKHIADFDLIHIHGLYNDPAVAAFEEALRSGRPYVSSLRGMLVKKLIRSKNRLFKEGWIALWGGELIENASIIHLTSLKEECDLSEYAYSTKKNIIIPNGIELSGTIELPGPDKQEKRRVTFLGRVHPKKNIEVLLEVLRNIPDLHLDILGVGDLNYEASLKKIAHRLRVTDRVEFVGFANEDMKAKYLSKSIALIVPSHNENFANVTLEALSYGCPVIVSDQVGSKDVLLQHDCGIVTDGSVDEISNAIKRLLDEPGLHERLRQNARQCAAEYSWDKIAEQMLKCYEKVV